MKIYKCDGCGRVTHDAEKDLRILKRAGHLSCCPERKMVEFDWEPEATGDLISRAEAVKAAEPDPYDDPEVRAACAGIQIELRALPAAPAPQKGEVVKVKPLVWSPYGPHGVSAKPKLTGWQYSIFPSLERHGEFAMQLSGDRKYSYFPAIDAAKAAAQADYEARVLATLDLPATAQKGEA